MNSVFGDRRTIFILLGPALLLYTLLKVAPIMWSFGLSFFEGNTLRGFEWVGFENFSTFFTDDAALQSVGVSVGFAIAATIGQVALSYGIALVYVLLMRKGYALRLTTK